MHQKICRLLCLVIVLGLAAFASAQGVIISEFLASNAGGLRDEDGDSPDWIELYNPSGAGVSLAGWYLTDDAADLTKWEFPNVEIDANGFLVIFASGKDRRTAGSPLHASFSLSASGEYLALIRPDGVTVASHYSPVFPEQYENRSYGLSQVVNASRFITSNSTLRVLAPTNGALGTNWISTSFYDVAWQPGTNGVGYEASVAGFAVKVFKGNINISTLAQAEQVISDPARQISVSAENRGVINYFNTGSQGFYGDDFSFPGLTINSDQEDFVMEATATITFPAPGQYSFGVNSDDGFRLAIGSFISSCDCLRGASETVVTFNVTAAGDYPLRLVFFERGGGSEVELYAAPGAFAAWNPSSFRLVGDTANGGLAVRSTSVGSGSNLRSAIRTDIQAQMQNRSSSAFVRIPFALANTNQATLTLETRYDDGFIAYLNGVEVARRNAPAAPQFSSVATVSRTNNVALEVERIGLTSMRHLLRVGGNLLAIHGLNDATNGNDFLVQAELVEYRATSGTNYYFAAPTPGTFNNAATAAFVADTKFSHDRGFYETNFSLSITSATAGATIYYTTNGSVPAPGSGYVYSGPIPIGGTVTVRAAAYRSGYQPTSVDTHSYIFVNDVVFQSTNGASPGPGWPAPGMVGGQVIDYGMDPRIANSPPWSMTIRDDLKALPSFSIVTTISNLFDPANGIYVQPGGAGIQWERPTSLELIYPDGRKGFQVNCGVRIRGGFSRSGDNPKHAFRFAFRDDYGARSLKFPLFASQNGTSEFDGFDLRTFQNYSWSFGGDPGGNFMRDQFSRDTQIAMGQHAERGDYFHLYINGVYWGVYNTCERPEASYGASYYGGEPGDYDVIKVDPQLGYNIEATDGNMDAWTQLWRAATNGFASDANYFAVQGLNLDGTLNPAYTNLIDIPNLVDYMLVIFWGGNLDAPISEFLGNTGPNNWYGSRSRQNTGGFRFFAHDSEHTLLNAGANRLGPYPAGDPVAGGGLPKSNPQYVWQQLTANAEFRMAVADRVQKHFFNNGALTLGSVQQRYLQRSNELYRAVVCESARWGDSKRPTAPLTRTDWINAVSGVWNSFIPTRSSTVLSQLRAQGLFPNINAPGFSTNSGIVPAGYTLSISNSNPTGLIYYTVDGSDPRSRGGGINPAALVYNGPLVVNTYLPVRARVRDGSTWSAITEAWLYPIQDYAGLLITEIMYHPPDIGATSGDEFEFIELKNVGATTLDLSGATFSSGVTFTFTNGTRLAPGAFFVLSRNPAFLKGKYPGLVVHGTFTGRLDNGGESLALRHALGAQILSLSYNDRSPWPIAADGHGFSIVPRLPNANPDPEDASNWRASSVVGGSPGADDPQPPAFPLVVVNEVLTHTVLPEVDRIELFNLGDTLADVGGWFLSDDAAQPKKFRIPPGTTIQPYSFVSFDEADFNATPGIGPTFSLSAMGDQVYLTSANASSNLTGYSHGFAFGAAAPNASFGRYLNSIGEELFPAQVARTFDATNAGPRVGPVVITEIQYHPAAGFDEFIELVNTASTNVPLFDPAFPTNTWQINGLGYTFPTNIVLPPGGFLVVAGTNPAAFRAKYSVPAGAQVIGPFAGALQNDGERLELLRPEPPTTNGVPYVVVDEVRFNDKLPWPVSADGAGPSLQRVVDAAFGNDPTNWFASGISAGRASAFNAAPTVTITQPIGGAYIAPTSTVSIAALANDPDGSVIKVEFYANGTRIGERSTEPYSVPWTNPAPATYALTARVYDNNFAVTISPPVTIHVLAPTPVSLVSTGATWRYLDNGTDQGTIWAQRSFNAASWSTGVAELGYGDAGEGRPEATVIGYGPNAGAKYITTYFRKEFLIDTTSSYQGLTVSVMRDDGAIAYLNGVEIFRNNMPTGPVNYLTGASAAVGGNDEATFYSTNVNPTLLVEGTNVLAVEIHQSGATSSDLSFDASLVGMRLVFPPTITTQPFDQAVAPGATVTFSPAVNGSASLLFQWRLHGTNLTGATNLTLQIVNAQLAHAGPYTLTVWNSAGTVTSRAATLTVGQLDSDSDGMPDAWENVFGLNAGAANDATGDLDADGMNNVAEYRAGTIPTNAASVLKLHWVSSPPRFEFVAQSNVTYVISMKTNTVLTQWRFLTNVLPQSQVRTVEVVDPTPRTNHARFYRITVP